MAERAPLRFVVASINFFPDHAGIAIYATDLPVFLAERGHAVCMVSGFPYYPIWKKQPHDRRRLFRRDNYRGVNVLRGYLYVPTRVTALKRVWHELTFCMFAAMNFLRAGRPAAIVVFSPPMPLCAVALFFKTLWRCPLLVNVQDLPVEAATSLGIVKRGVLTRLALRLESMLYRRSDFVATISPGMRATMLAKGVPPERLGVYPNWIDLSAARWRVASGRFLESQPQALQHFTVAYAGNLGLKQGVRCLLELAGTMSQEPVHFFVIGDGADRPALVQLAADLNLRNLTFLPMLAPDRYREMLQDVDLIFVAQKAGTGNIFFPSKLLGIMAAGRPMLVSADPSSELARVVENEKVGLVSPFGDVAALRQNLERLRLDPALREEMAGHCFRHVLEYDRATILSRIERKLLELVEAKRRF